MREYRYCCSCGKEKRLDGYKNCDNCYYQFSIGQLFNYCNICNCKFSKPSPYMTCYDCYQKMLTKNYHAERN